MLSRCAVAVLVVAASLVTAACTPQELGEYFAAEDLRASDQPVEVAAGHAATATDTDRAAQGLVDEGLRDKDPDKLQKAQEQRPEDPRYPLYLAALTLADDGNHGRFWLGMQRTAAQYVQERSRSTNASRDELYNQWLLIVMGSIDTALTVERDRNPSEPERINHLEREFCFTLYVYLRDDGPASRDVLNTMFLGGPACESVW